MFLFKIFFSHYLIQSIWFEFWVSFVQTSLQYFMSFEKSGKKSYFCCFSLNKYCTHNLFKLSNIDLFDLWFYFISTCEVSVCTTDNQFLLIETVFNGKPLNVQMICSHKPMTNNLSYCDLFKSLISHIIMQQAT